MFVVTTNGHEHMLIFGCGCHACRVRGNCSRHGCLYRGPGTAYRQASLRDTSADLQLLATNVYARRRCDSALCRTGVGNRFNCPHPAEVAILVEEPSSATAFPDLHSPVIAVAGIAKTNVTAAAMITPHRTPIRNMRFILS